MSEHLAPKRPRLARTTNFNASGAVPGQRTQNPPPPPALVFRRIADEEPARVEKRYQPSEEPLIDHGTRAFSQLWDQQFSSTGHQSQAPDSTQILSHGPVPPYSPPPIDLDDEEDPVEDLLLLRTWDVPAEVCEAYASVQVKSMYEWQAECLSVDGVINGRNLIYSAPTSAGKTLVAEVLMCRALMSGRKAIVVLPFISIISEKVDYFNLVFGSMDLNIRGYYHGQGGSPTMDQVDVAICTYQKANSIMNRMLTDGCLDSVGILVVDELQMIGDEQNGVLLEFILTKLLYAGIDSCQIVGLSATLPNIDAVATWLNAALFHTDYRPIKLNEHIACEKMIYTLSEGTWSQMFREGANVRMSLIDETASAGHSVLVFGLTRAGTEKQAEAIFYSLSPPSPEIAKELNVLVAALDKVGASSLQKAVVRNGVAFHHAGLTNEERKLVEGGFRSGCIRVLSCTTTLSAGVNLPARRVIISSSIIWNSGHLDGGKYRQMSGRAGRKGMDSVGESYITCERSQLEKMKKMIENPLAEAVSCLSKDDGMACALLEAMVDGVVSSSSDVLRYARCSFLTHTVTDEGLRAAIKAATDYLPKHGFAGFDKDRWIPTQLGYATILANMKPRAAAKMHSQLTQARIAGIILGNPLHLLYHLTPLYEVRKIRWDRYQMIFSNLSPADDVVAEKCNITQAFLNRKAMGGVTADDSETFRYHRFYQALILRDLIDEMCPETVAAKYDYTPGDLQSLQQNAGAFAATEATFCQRLGWTDIEVLINQFRDRLNFGVQGDLLDLCQIPHVGGQRARALFNAGYRSAATVAAASYDELKYVLDRSIPFQTTVRAKEGDMARKVLDGAGKLLKERAREALTIAGGMFPSGVDAGQLAGLLDTLYVSTKPKKKSQGSDSGSTSPGSSPLKFYDVGTSRPALKRLVERWKTRTKWSFNFAPPAVPPSDTIGGVAICLEPKSVYWIPLGNPPSTAEAETDDEFAPTTLSERWQSWTDQCRTEQHAIAFDAKKQLKLLGTVGAAHPRLLRDPRIASWMQRLNVGEARLSIEQIAERHHISERITMLLPPAPWPAADRACRIAVQAYRLQKTLDSQLCDMQRRAFERIEMPVVPLLAKMELTGVAFQQSMCVQHRELCDQRIKALTTLAHAIVGRAFDLSRPSEVAKVLFDPYESGGLDLEARAAPKADQDPKRQKTAAVVRGRRRRTSAQTLSSLHDLSPMPQVISEFRSLHVLRSNMIILPRHAKIGKNDQCRVHTTYSQTASETGRIIAQDPSLQCVPHGKDVPSLLMIKKAIVNANFARNSVVDRDPVQHRVLQIKAAELAVKKVFEESKMMHCQSDQVVSLREAFKAPHACVLLSADYCQLELRLLAHLSGDTQLRRLFKQDGPDFFFQVAARLNDVDVGSVTKKQRDRAKRITYGILYGTGSASLATELEVTPDEAQEFINEFWDKFPGVREYHSRVIAGLKELGYVATMTGRRRSFAPSKNQAKIERQAFNTVLQGSAADLVKKAMVDIDCALSAEFGVRRPVLVMEVHDELVYEVAEDQLEKTMRIVRVGMESAESFEVEMAVKMTVGRIWQ